MSEPEGISVDNLRLLAERAGLRLSPTELEQLKPMFDFYARDLQAMHELELGAEDMAVVYSPS